MRGTTRRPRQRVKAAGLRVKQVGGGQAAVSRKYEYPPTTSPCVPPESRQNAGAQRGSLIGVRVGVQPDCASAREERRQQKKGNGTKCGSCGNGVGEIVADSGEFHVILGQPAGIMGAERQRHFAVANVYVRVVVDGLGGFGDLIDEVQSMGKILELVSFVDNRLRPAGSSRGVWADATEVRLR